MILIILAICWIIVLHSSYVVHYFICRNIGADDLYQRMADADYDCHAPGYAENLHRDFKAQPEVFKSQQAALAAANGYIEEIISGRRLLKYLTTRKSQKKEFGQLNRDLKEKQVKAQFLSGIVMPVNVNLNSINYALNTVVGAYLCIAHGFDIGGLAVFDQLFTAVWAAD